MPKENIYTISEVTKLTGTTEFLLRTWELRYNLVQPKRTTTGRRVYSSKEVMKLSKIVSLLDQGYKIGKLAALSQKGLNKLENQQHLNFKRPQDLYPPVKKVYEYLIVTNWLEIKKIFQDQRKRRTSRDYLKNFILPIATEMSHRSQDQRIDIIQEHILSSLIKENLYALKPSNRKSSTKILFATIEGDHHDLGLLISKTIAEAYGAQCIYLGSHVPQKELAEACIRLQPDYIVIGTSLNTAGRNRDNLLKYINFVDQHIPQKVNLWLGGNATEGLSLHLDRPFKIFSNLDEYAQQLEDKI